MNLVKNQSESEIDLPTCLDSTAAVYSRPKLKCVYDSIVRFGRSETHNVRRQAGTYDGDVIEQDAELGRSLGKHVANAATDFLSLRNELRRVVLGLHVPQG